MALYDDSLSSMLSRTDFPIEHEYSDAWISSNGEVIPVGSFCHRKIAYDIISRMDVDKTARLKKMKREMLDLKKYGDPYGKLPTIKSRYDSLRKNESYHKLFNNYHETYNLDEAEFLVAVMGYVAIENKHVIYSQKLINSLQTAALGLGYDIHNGNKILIK